MDLSKFKTGDTAYTINGNEVEFIALSDGEAVVKQILDTEYDEPYYGKPFTTGKLFSEPPTERFSEKVVALKEQIVKLEFERNTVEREVSALLQSDKERKERMMKHRALQRIDDFIAGKMTHFVFRGYGVKIISFEEAIRYKESDHDRVPKGTKLLSLFGQANGNLEWMLHRYSDWSSGFDTVIPASSYEEAMEIATGLINEQYEKWRKEDKKSGRYCNAAIYAQKLGIPVPDDVREANYKYSLDAKQRNIDKARLDLEKAAKELEDFENGIEENRK